MWCLSRSAAAGRYGPQSSAGRRGDGRETAEAKWLFESVQSFVVYAGAERYPVAEGVEAIWVREVAGLLGGV
jgi:hypothetical protein